MRLQFSTDTQNRTSGKSQLYLLVTAQIFKITQRSTTRSKRSQKQNCCIKKREADFVHITVSAVQSIGQEAL